MRGGAAAAVGGIGGVSVVHHHDHAAPHRPSRSWVHARHVHFELIVLQHGLS